MHRTVALVNLGENLSSKLDRLANKLNSLQSSFHFEVTDSRPNIGAPMLDGIWYSLDNLFNQLEHHGNYSHYDYVIGITHVRIAKLDNPSVDIEKDYFACTNYNKFSVITEAMANRRPLSANIYQYLSYLIMGDLLTLMCQTKLDHPNLRYCLFDECDDRSTLASGMLEGKICSICLPKLEEFNISTMIVDDVLRVLDWCKRTTFSKSAMTSITNPISSIILGAALGWAASEYLHSDIWSIGIIIGTVFLAHVLLIAYYRHLSK